MPEPGREGITLQGSCASLTHLAMAGTFSEGPPTVLAEQLPALEELVIASPSMGNGDLETMLARWQGPPSPLFCYLCFCVCLCFVKERGNIGAVIRGGSISES